MAIDLLPGETAQSGRFDLPPQTRNAEGKTRRVGFEVEFSGIDLDAATDAVLSATDGELVEQTQAQRCIRTESLGEFTLELDWDFLKRKASESEPGNDNADWIEQLSQAAAMFVPVEVVCPPVALNEMHRLTPLIQQLRLAGATGTESPFAAYGVHINAEIPRLDADTLLAYLRAFSLLQWWLVDAHQVDLTRRVSPYIDLYPQNYLKRLLATNNTSMDEIFDDYLEHNATRNRALDLLPLLAEIDMDRVQATVADPKVKPRPTFHYRLPNCHISHPDWTLANAWNTWCVVERLANQPDALDALARSYLSAEHAIWGVSRSEWINTVNQWLNDHELV